MILMFNKEEIKALMGKIAIACPEYNVANYKEIGAGSRGIAYDLGNNIVMKITKDRSEAQASNAIKGKKLKHTNEIYDVFLINYGDRKYFLIFQKLLYKLTGPATNAMEDFFNVFLDKELALKYIDLSTYDIDGFMEGFLEEYTYCKEYEEDLRRVWEFIKDAHKELLEYDVRFSDFHIGNIMMDGLGKYKLIDLGYSQAPQSPIERKLLEYLRKRLGV